MSEGDAIKTKKHSDGYKGNIQQKNLAWFLPRPKRDHYKGGMPLHCEEWLIQLSKDILGQDDLKILNVFSGMNKYGTRIDINPKVNPDIVGDVHKLSTYIKEKFDLIIADPPYSDEENIELYGNNKHLNYKVWTSECTKVLSRGGILIVYHKYIMPNPDPEVYEVSKRVFIGTRTYHLPRVAILFKKKL